MIDVFIIAGYLITTLVLGYLAGRKIKTMRDFCLPPGAGFPYVMLVGTIVATDIGGNSTLGASQKIYQYGVFYMMGVLIPFGLVMTGLFAGPGINKFRGHYSAGEIMRTCYNRQAQIITGIFAVLLSIATVAVQVKVMAWVCEYFFGVTHTWGAILACAVMIIYSAYGGVRAVTFTDCLQMLMILTMLPELLGTMINYSGGYQGFFQRIPPSHLSIPAHLSTQDLWAFAMFAFFPMLNPSIVQRLLLSRNEKEVKRAFCTAACFEVLYVAMLGLTCIATWVYDPSIEGKAVFLHLINTLMTPGIRGFCVAGILAAIMSTGDSWLNASAIAVAHDVIKPLRGDKLADATELLIARFSTLAIGMAALFMVFVVNDVFDVALLRVEIWCPVVTIPLWMGLLGIRVRPYAFFLSAAAGLTMYFVTKSSLGQYIPTGTMLTCLVANGCTFGLCRYWDYLSGKIPPPIQGPKLDGDGNLYKPSPFPKLEQTRAQTDIKRVF